MAWGLKPNFEAIPPELCVSGRWCVWKALPKPKPKRGFDKIPYQPARPKFGASTQDPSQWGTFAEAVAAFQSGEFDGIGRLIDSAERLTFIDLDHCIEDDGFTVKPWAQEIVDALDTYTEISPSGEGLRLVFRGQAPADFTNHSAGIEVYTGSAPRYVTLTGCVLNPKLRADPPAFERIYQQYKPAPTAETEILPQPALLAREDLPQLVELGLGDEYVRILRGEFGADGDRSKALQIATKQLYLLGLTDEQVLSVLAYAPGSMRIAKDHRRQDDDKAITYLWQHHCLKARSLSPVATFLGATRRPDVPGLVHISEVRAKLGPIDWLIEGIFERNTTGVLFGDPESYKSFLALDMALHVAAGLPWCDHPVARQGPVIYVAGEGHGGFARRIAAWEAVHGPIGELDMYFTTRPADLYTRESAKALTEQIRALADELERPPAFIVIDTLARNFGPGDENSTADMNQFMLHVDLALRVPFEAVVLIVHHTGHSHKERARGSMALRGALDFEYRAIRSKAPMVVQLVCSKMKDAEHPPDHWLRGEVKHVGLEADITSLVFSACEPVIAVEGPRVRHVAIRELLISMADDTGRVDRRAAREAALSSGLVGRREAFNQRLVELEEDSFLVRLDGGKEVQLCGE